MECYLLVFLLFYVTFAIKINNYVCSQEFLDLICVSMAVAGIIIIIIIIINFLFKRSTGNFIKNFHVLVVVVDIVIIIIEVI